MLPFWGYLGTLSQCYPSEGNKGTSKKVVLKSGSSLNNVLQKGVDFCQRFSASMALLLSSLEASLRLRGIRLLTPF